MGGVNMSNPKAAPNPEGSQWLANHPLSQATQSAYGKSLLSQGVRPSFDISQGVGPAMGKVLQYRAEMSQLPASSRMLFGGF